MTALGFREHGEGAGRAMQLEVDAPADEAGCRRLAELVTSLLVDVLGYDGRQPLAEHLIRGEAGDLKAQVTSITLAQVRQLVEASALGAAVPGTAPDDGATTLTVRTATGGWLEIRMLAPAGPGRFGALDCVAAIDDVGPLTMPLLTELNARLFGCAVCQFGQLVVLRGGFALYAGVAMASVLAFLQHMAAQLDYLQPLLASRLAGSMRTTH